MNDLRLRHAPLDVRLRHTFRIARGASDVRRNLLVEAEAFGLLGRGEAAPILRYQEDMQLDEIAHALKIPIQTVKSRLHRSVNLLREKMLRRQTAVQELRQA